MMILLVIFLLFAIQKNVLMIFIMNIENVNSVILKEFSNDTMIMKMGFHKNGEISMHVLKTCILD